jgi:NAD+ diphosphatase
MVTLGQRPALGYIANRLDRAATRRGDDAALKQYYDDAQAGTYVIGGELVVLKAGEPCDPLFNPREARALGAVRESVFLGLDGTAPRFGFGLDQDAIERLKARNDLKISDLRSIAVQGMVAAHHLPP